MASRWLLGDASRRVLPLLKRVFSNCKVYRLSETEMSLVLLYSGIGALYLSAPAANPVNSPYGQRVMFIFGRSEHFLQISGGLVHCGNADFAENLFDAIRDISDAEPF